MLTDLGICASMALNYCLLVINYRAVAQGRYLPTAISDALIAAVGYFIIRRVAEADSPKAFVAYVIGGVIGSMVGMWLSKRLHADGQAA